MDGLGLDFFQCDFIWDVLYGLKHSSEVDDTHVYDQQIPVTMGFILCPEEDIDPLTFVAQLSVKQLNRI